MINLQYLLKAKKQLSANSWNYLVGGSEDEISLRRNRQGFQSYHLRGSVLRDVSQVELETEFLGIQFSSPVIAAPIGGLTQFHEMGDIEWAKGLAKADTFGAISGVARFTPERIIKESQAKLFYQLYFFGDDQWIKDQVVSAERLGYRAIVVTVDTAHYAKRERDHLAEFNPRYAGFRDAPEPPNRDRNSKLDWEELEKIKSYSRLPLIIKGISTRSDCEEAGKRGADAIWISNHGGRQLEYSAPTIKILEELSPWCRNRRLPIIIDGGIRRGVEGAIALALGADLVALGRLPVFGLAADGAAGVGSVIRNFQDELLQSIGLLGATNPIELRDLSEEMFSSSELSPSIETKWDQIEWDGTVFEMQETESKQAKSATERSLAQDH